MRAGQPSKSAALQRAAALLIVGTAWGLVQAGCRGSDLSTSEETGESTAEHAHGEPRRAAGLSAVVLSPADRDEVTTIRVSAHVGAVTLRKQHGVWVMAGQRGCIVPESRVSRALDNLVGLESRPSTDPIPVGTRFELQIDVLIGEFQVIHFEIAGRDDGSDLVRLLDDSSIRVWNLDRALWSAEDSAWCRD